MKIADLLEKAGHLDIPKKSDYFDSFETNLIVQAIDNRVGTSFSGEKRYVYL